jgi:hypothetical protein
VDHLRPELKSLHSPHLPEGQLPDDPSHAEVFIQAFIGPVSGEGEESFGMTVVTPSMLAGFEFPRWGRGLLLVDCFSWPAVQTAVEKLLRHCSGETWLEVGQKINRYLEWEFDDYTDHERT